MNSRITWPPPTPMTIPLNMEDMMANGNKPFSQADLPLNETTSADEYTKGNVILIVEDEESIRNFMKERLLLQCSSFRTDYQRPRGGCR